MCIFGTQIKIVEKCYVIEYNTTRIKPAKININFDFSSFTGFENSDIV